MSSVDLHVTQVLEALPGSSLIDSPPPGYVAVINVVSPESILLRVSLPEGFPTNPPTATLQLVTAHPVTMPTWHPGKSTLLESVEAALAVVRVWWGEVAPVSSRAIADLLALPDGAPILDDIAQNSLCREGYVFQLQYSSELRQATTHQLTENETAANRNLHLRPKIETLASEVENLQQTVCEEKNKIASLQTKIAPVLQMATTDGLTQAYKKHITSLEQESDTLGQKLISAKNDGSGEAHDPDTLTAAYLEKRIAFYKATLSLQAYQAPSQQ